MWYWNYPYFFFVILYENKQCFSVVSRLIVAVSQYFVAWTPNISLQAERMRSEKGNVGREGQQNIVTRLQWAKIQLRNIAYRMKNDKEKIRIIEYHILFCAIVHDFSWNFNFTESEVKSIFYWYSTTLNKKHDAGRKIENQRWALFY